jgi:hypothetical protein
MFGSGMRTACMGSASESNDSMFMGVVPFE